MTLLRRQALFLLGSVIATGARAATSEGNARAFAFEKPEGGLIALKDFADKPILIVNTATACGLLPGSSPAFRLCGRASAGAA